MQMAEKKQITTFSYETVKSSLKTLLSHKDVPHAALILNPSTIPNAGLGLFAAKAFKRGEPITEYYGQLITQEEAKRRQKQGKCSHIRRHVAFRYCIDGSRMRDGTEIVDPHRQLIGCGLAQYANHGKNVEKKRKRRSDANDYYIEKNDHSNCNADYEFVDSAKNEAAMKRFFAGKSFTLDENERITFIYALRDIEAGEEILLDYGNDYWKKTFIL